MVLWWFSDGGAVVKTRFDRFVLDTTSRELLSDGRAIHLSPKAFQLLALLIANRPKAFAKTELQQHLWPDTFVQETSLSSIVKEIRRALEDNARSPRFIRTHHRWGFAFCGDATELVNAASRGTCWLVTANGERLGLAERESVVGRDGATATVWIDAETISRRHARIALQGDQIMLEDLGSKNGTYVNGRRINRPSRLNDGDEVRFGSVKCTFRTSIAVETKTALADEDGAES